MKTKTAIFRFSLFLSLFSFMQCLSAQPVPALIFSGHTDNFAADNSTRGYAFNVSDPSGVFVTHLSFYDADAGGLGESHEVGLWDPLGNLMVSGVVPFGTQAPLDSSGLFRLVDVPDTFLPSGSGYVVGARYTGGGTDYQAMAWTSSQTAPGIEWVEGRIEDFTTPLTYPTRSINVPSLVGGSFQVVPEPSSVHLLAFGLLFLRFNGHSSKRRESL